MHVRISGAQEMAEAHKGAKIHACMEASQTQYYSKENGVYVCVPLFAMLNTNSCDTRAIRALHIIRPHARVRPRFARECLPVNAA
jgi:hypothetical protein